METNIDHILESFGLSQNIKNYDYINQQSQKESKWSDLTESEKSQFEEIKLDNDQDSNYSVNDNDINDVLDINEDDEIFVEGLDDQIDNNNKIYTRAREYKSLTRSASRTRALINCVSTDSRRKHIKDKFQSFANRDFSKPPSGRWSTPVESSEIVKNDLSVESKFKPLPQLLAEENDPDNVWLSGFEWDTEIDVANKQIFRNQNFRPKQREIINATKSNRDVIGVIPTGGGKSLTFQLTAMTEEGVSIVIMPLISLIQDQIMQMEEIGIETLFLRENKDINDILSQITSKNIKAKLVFITPEKMSQSHAAKWVVRNLYDSKLLMRFVIDEVHCVSHWGQDFRKDYLELKMLRIEYPGVPILGLTATATAQVITDIANILGLKNMIKFQCSFNRPNLFYEVKQKKD